jgi:hypothetical protein
MIQIKVSERVAALFRARKKTPREWDNTTLMRILSETTKGEVIET